MVQRCTTLTSLQMTTCTFKSDASIYFSTMMQHCAGLQVLQVVTCPWFNNECYRAVEHYPQLRTLRCSHAVNATGVTIAGVLSHLHHLETFDLSHFSFGNLFPHVCAALAEHCPRLESLKFYTPRICQSELNLLTERCTNLESLEIHSYEESFALNCINLKKLRKLVIYSQKPFIEKSIFHILLSGPVLTCFIAESIANVWSNPDIVRTVANHCPRLTCFRIGQCTEQVLESLTELQFTRKVEKCEFRFAVREVLKTRPTLLNSILKLVFQKLGLRL